jgi:hypothetical protein
MTLWDALKITLPHPHPHLQAVPVGRRRLSIRVMAVRATVIRLALTIMSLCGVGEREIKGIA